MKRATKLRARLEDAARTSGDAERTLRVAAVLTDAFRIEGIQPVLVGGGAVEVYTRAAYMTADLDFVAPRGDATRRVMEGLGFRREGRVWFDAALSIVVEFPSSTLAPARATEVEVDGVGVAIIEVEDLVVNRLAAWKYWRWHPDGVAAGLLLAIHSKRLDAQRLHDRCEDEDVVDALDAVLNVLRSGSSGQLSLRSMETAHRSLRQKKLADAREGQDP